MGKPSSSRADKAPKADKAAKAPKAPKKSAAPTDAATGKPLVAVSKKALDTGISSLFASSAGPVAAPSKSKYQRARDEKRAAGGDEDEDMASDADEKETVLAKAHPTGEQDKPKKKRKRGGEDEIEDVYLRKLAKEELKEEEARKKKQKTEEGSDSDSDSDADETEVATAADAAAAESDSDDDDVIPQHETEAPEKPTTDAEEIEKAARTVFLGNVSSEAITSKSAKKTLMRHLASFIPDMADSTPPHKVESIRFRSTAFTNTLPKKAAFAKKEVHDATTKSTNAYAVYSTQVAARQAATKLNGTLVLSRHLRVDSVAHPAKVDHRRCVFVGNLGFVDDESAMAAADPEKKMRAKPPMDVEEGLWVHFSKAGKVESVRVIRDSKTRVGKGIAYVQYAEENSVEAALLYNEQKYPPLLPRKLRVTRAKAPKKNQNKPVPVTHRPKSTGVYNEKLTDEQKTQAGRSRNMLGNAAKAGAASFVFEGHRASAGSGKSGLKLNGKRKGKPSNRSTKRAASWQEKGGKGQFGKKSAE